MGPAAQSSSTALRVRTLSPAARGYGKEGLAGVFCWASPPRIRRMPEIPRKHVEYPGCCDFGGGGCGPKRPISRHRPVGEANRCSGRRRRRGQAQASASRARFRPHAEISLRQPRRIPAGNHRRGSDRRWGSRGVEAGNRGSTRARLVADRPLGWAPTDPVRLSASIATFRRSRLKRVGENGRQWVSQRSAHTRAATETANCTLTPRSSVAPGADLKGGPRQPGAMREKGCSGTPETRT